MALILCAAAALVAKTGCSHISSARKLDPALLPVVGLRTILCAVNIWQVGCWRNVATNHADTHTVLKMEFSWNDRDNRGTHYRGSQACAGYR
jgi:hypothetical protein